MLAKLKSTSTDLAIISMSSASVRITKACTIGSVPRKNRRSNLIAMHMNGNIIDMLYKTEAEEDMITKYVLLSVGIPRS